MSIKGVDLTVSRYVGRVANGTSLEDLRKFIADQEVDVVDLRPLTTKHESFQSYKLVVKRNDLVKIEKEEFWPAGIVIRRYFQARQPPSDGAGESQRQNV